MMNTHDEPEAPLEQYTIQQKEFLDLLLIIASVVRKPICFYDANGECLTFPPNPFVVYEEYCSSRRRNDPAFEKACHACDAEHIAHAAKTGLISVYRCHAGLYDCVVPIFDPDGRFLGAYIVGQQPDSPDSSGNSAHDSLFLIGDLLARLSDYIVSHEILGYQRLPWVEATDLYLKSHCGANITLRQLARVTGCSLSFLTHSFTKQFHMPFKQYQRKIRMEYAMSLLKKESSVKVAAEKTGFPNSSFFSRQFKQYWGKPPSAYLRQNAPPPCGEIASSSSLRSSGAR